MGEKGVKPCFASRSCCGFLAHKIGWVPLVRLSMARFLPLPVSFLVGSFAVSLLVGSAYYWIIVASFLKPDPSFLGCRPDGEGSWSIGIYYGKSPLSLSPIELQENRVNANNSAWPVANPVLTCATLSAADYPSNFVADPFLYVQDNDLYLFFETKHSIKLKGEIGVARSSDQGVTWQFLGIALVEDWHLSYPFVFNYQNQIYMMPEGNKNGDLRLYRATKFPLEWKLEKVLIKKPLVDASMIQYEGFDWIFASDFTRAGTEKNAELEIWYSRTPLGPWLQHKQNPIYRADKSLGARNAGRLFIYGGSLYRPGQDCGSTYGKRVRLYRVEKLTKDEYKEVPVESGFEMPQKGRNAWNGNRYHHFDTRQLQSGNWIAVMDGDRVPSGDATWRFFIGCFCFSFAVSMTAFIGFVCGTLKSVSPSSYCSVLFRRNDSGTFRSYPRFNLKVRKIFSGAYKSSRCCLRERMSPQTWLGLFILCILSLVGLAFVCMGVQFLYGGSGAEPAYLYKGQYSKFTMVTMTYEARLWNLKMYVKHYSRCESVREIVVVWNKGTPPDLSEFDTAVPVRIRVEKVNSLNNRFKPDPLIKTRAVFELDDDIMMTCNDLEKGFKVWRENPKKIVGFYPRLIDGDPLLYRNERYARGKNRYNLILTGAAFMDSEFAFKKYWSEEAREGRDFVHKNFNCEDLLMNFLYSNSSRQDSGYGRTVEYVHPAWAIDTSKLSSVAISRNTQQHYDVRTKCLAKFKEIYGPLLNEKLEFGSRRDKWDK